MGEFFKPLSIYVVEDSEILQQTLASAIAALGAELIGCSGSAQTAVADLSMLRPDLIVIDLSLKFGSGFDVLRALQQQGLLPEAIKVVLTNHANDEYRNRSLSLGASPFFAKTDTSQLLALIGDLAKSHRPPSSEVVDTSRH